jgi:hypothetical protein
MIYVSKDGVEGSVAKLRSNSISEEGSEKNIVENDEEVSSEENLNKIKRTMTSGMHT